MSSNHLFNVCLAAVLAIGLTACSSSDNDTPAEEPVAMPEPMPEPEPEPDPGPTDLEETQAAAVAAAAAAMTASANAEASSDSAAAATATLATLQTGADANAGEMGGNEHAKAASYAAKDAADAAAAAAAASAAAAAATTGDAGETAWRMAVAAQEDAEAAEASASTHAAAAIEAAMMELHIDGTMKWVDIVDDDGNVTGMSSVDATTGMLTTGTVGVDRKITGLLIGAEPSHMKASSEGQHFIQDSGPATETKYKQAIEAGTVEVGKRLDTSDDKARLLLMTHYEGEKKVRVFVDRADNATNDDGTNNLLDNNSVPIAGTTYEVGTLVTGATAKSIGMYYEAEDRIEANDALPAVPVIVGTPATTVDSLDAYDRVKVNDDMGGPAKGVEIFEITLVDGANTHTGHARLERTTTEAGADTPTPFYQLVDIVADQSMTDGGDSDQNPDHLRPTTNIPVATAYDYIHFGVWAGLSEAKKSDGSQTIADLGIGFVQNIKGSITERQGIGTATYNGDWAATVRREYASDAEKGAIKLDNDRAVLTANFEKNEFKAVLARLATLEGTLSGNGFSGVKATDITHEDLDSDGTFKGSFTGGIYGPAGTEAAGVFNFEGEEAGAFRGAFGGAQ